MIAALLLAATAAPSAIDAERAFAADAQKLGQWTAFRKYATDDALMFVPQPTNAQTFLKDRKDPPASVFWWPGQSYVSCDGNTAINTGPWVREGGKAVGYFTTVWKRQPDGSWKWIYDGGDSLKTARAEGGDIKPAVASCQSPTVKRPLIIGFKDGKMGGGNSDDRTLAWDWALNSKNGARSFRAHIWNGNSWQTVIQDFIEGAE